MADTDDRIEQEIRVDAPPEVVFEYFVDPDKMRHWSGVSHELDPRPGGVYHVDMGRDHVVRGEFVEVDRPRRVCFTWGWEGEGQLVGPGASTVEVTLTPDGDGTVVRLVHQDLPAGAVGPHTAGWRHYMARMAIAAAGGDPGPDEGIA